MRSVVIYATRSGNTRTIAEAIGESLRLRGELEIFAVEDAPASIPAETDLLVIGGPTEGHGMSEPMKAYVDTLEAESVRGVAAATFDTRLDWPRWLSGSASDRISDALRERGARIVAPEESFMVSMEPALDAGEEDRARAWGDRLASLVTPSEAATR
jgi:flavodoxin